MNKKKIEDAIRIILEEIGEDINREGIKHTPTRVARLYENLFYGYKKKLKVMNEEERNTYVPENIIPITVFENKDKEMLIRKVNFLSTCEHHLATITQGQCWVGIIPDEKLLGMNKIDKIVKFFAARLQIQERMTSQIADWINDNIKPKGVIVIIKANHLCSELQGDGGNFTTSAVRGVFLKPEEGKTPKEEFLKLINLNGGKE
jgi:GTP cyclohydrolase IA